MKEREDALNAYRYKGRDTCPTPRAASPRAVGTRLMKVEAANDQAYLPASPQASARAPEHGRWGYPDGPEDTSLVGLLDQAGRSGSTVAGLLFTAAIAALLADRLVGADLSRASNTLPQSPGFYVAFLLSYLAVPLTDFAIFRRLWNLPPAGFAALLRKRIANDMVVGYSGEVYFYLWARSRMRMVAAPFAAVKDVSILSAMAGNLVTLALVGLAAPVALPLLPDEYVRPVIGSVAILAAVLLAVALLRKGILSLPTAQVRWILGAQAARILASALLMALCWHIALPEVALSAWLLLSALRMLVSRLPILPAKEVVFAALAGFLVGFDGEIGGLVATTAILTLITHAAVMAVVLVAPPMRRLACRS